MSVPNAAFDKLRALQTMCAACGQRFYVELISEILSGLTEEMARHQALISEQSIESMATDIACAIVDPREDVVAMRHSAMTRLGMRLRNPFKSDIRRLASAIEAQRATTVQQGVVHESAVAATSGETPSTKSGAPDNG